MANTFWITAYLRAVIPSLAVMGFIAGISLNVTVSNLSSYMLVVCIAFFIVWGKFSFSELNSKDDYLWFLSEQEFKKTKLLVAYARLIGLGVIPGAALMSITQYSGSLGLSVFSLLTFSWMIISEGRKFDKNIKLLGESK